MSIEKKIRTSITWNTIESIIYQVILGAHQSFLYVWGGQHHYGLISTLFAFIYLTSTLIVGGFELAITPIFNEVSINRILFKRIILVNFFKQLGWAIVIGSILILTLPIIKLPMLSPTIIVLAVGTAVCEGIRKVFRVLLHLFFKSHIVAWIEVTLLMSYCISVWSGYYFLHNFPLALIITPLFCTSFISTFIYSLMIYKEYLLMTPGTTSSLRIIQAKLTRNRFTHIINTIGHALCSGNFLIPFFSALQGLEIAGLFKLVNYWCQTTTPIIQKIFGISAQASFAKIKTMPTSEKRALFFWFNTHLLRVLAVLLGSISITAFVVYALTTSGTRSVPWALIALSVLLLLSENIMIIYEKFCVAEEKSSYLLLCQSILIIGWLIGWHSSLITTPVHVLTWLIAIRFLSCGILAALVRRLLYFPANQQQFFPTKATKVYENTGLIAIPKNNALFTQKQTIKDSTKQFVTKKQNGDAEQITKL